MWSAGVVLPRPGPASPAKRVLGSRHGWARGHGDAIQTQEPGPPVMRLKKRQVRLQ